MATTSQTEKVFRLHVSVDDVTATFRDMNRSLKAATVNALNKVGRLINREIATDIKRNYNIKARTLRLGKTVRLRRADKRKEVPVFTISILKKGRGLALYSPIKRKAGVGVRVKAERKTVKGSFFIKTKRGMRFVARKSRKGGFVTRVSSSGKKYQAPRSQFLYGPSVAQLYKRRRAFKMIRKVIDREYEKELRIQFNNQFEKRR